MIRKLFAVATISAVLLMVGCRSAPLYNVTSSPVSAPKPVTLADVEKAIARAGVGLGWQIIPREPGKIEGVLALRTHRAVVGEDDHHPGLAGDHATHFLVGDRLSCHGHPPSGEVAGMASM